MSHPMSIVDDDDEDDDDDDDDDDFTMEDLPNSLRQATLPLSLSKRERERIKESAKDLVKRLDNINDRILDIHSKALERLRRKKIKEEERIKQKEAVEDILETDTTQTLDKLITKRLKPFRIKINQLQKGIKRPSKKGNPKKQQHRKPSTRRNQNQKQKQKQKLRANQDFRFRGGRTTIKTRRNDNNRNQIRTRKRQPVLLRRQRRGIQHHILVRNHNKQAKNHRRVVGQGRGKQSKKRRHHHQQRRHRNPNPIRKRRQPRN